jgi:hypothetical protein
LKVKKKNYERAGRHILFSFFFFSTRQVNFQNMEMNQIMKNHNIIITNENILKMEKKKKKTFLFLSREISFLTIPFDRFDLRVSGRHLLTRHSPNNNNLFFYFPNE